MRDFNLQNLGAGEVTMGTWGKKTMMYVRASKVAQTKPAEAALKYLIASNPNCKHTPLRAIAA